MARRSAVGEEEDLLAGLVPRLERRGLVDDDNPARLDVDALPRLAEQHCQRAAQRDEDLLLVGVEVAAPARMRRIAPHPRPRLGHVGRLGQGGRVARLLAFVPGPLLPLEVSVVDDVPGHGATIPSAPMAELRPVALPPAERTIGQLVAESIRFYGEHFWSSLRLGVGPAILAVVSANVSRRTALILSPTLFGALLSATYVYASVLVLGKRPSRGRLVVAWLAGWLVFAPVPFLVLAYVLPGLVWLASFALLVPVLVVEEASLRGAVGRAWRLARADYVHGIGSLITLAIVVLLTQAVLAFILRGFGDAAVWTAYFLASVVVSPLLFVGAALLYVDQAARAEVQ